MIRKQQAYYLGGALILLAVLYFGFNNYPAHITALEKSRALSGDVFDIAGLENEAHAGLPPDKNDMLLGLNAQLRLAADDSTRIGILKQLSGFWFSESQPLLAGLYARQVADLENSAESWSITGTTFAAGLTQGDLEEAKRTFARDQALDAFEKAISLEPSVVEHRINQALCYVEAPLTDQPMKGIQMLAGLAATYPEAPAPAYQLARLAVRTGQYDRARTRIEQALALAPQDRRIACLAIDIYTALELPEQAQALAPVCAGSN